MYAVGSLALVCYAWTSEPAAAAVLGLLLVAVGGIGWKRYHECLKGKGATHRASALRGDGTAGAGSSADESAPTPAEPDAAFGDAPGPTRSEILRTRWRYVALAYAIVATAGIGASWTVSWQAAGFVALAFATVGHFGWRCRQDDCEPEGQPAPPPPPEFKRCPHCAESIRWEATLCRYCRTEVSDRPAVPVAATTDQRPVPVRAKQGEWAELRKLLMGVALLVVLGAGGAWYYHTGGANTAPSGPFGLVAGRPDPDRLAAQIRPMILDEWAKKPETKGMTIDRIQLAHKGGKEYSGFVDARLGGERIQLTLDVVADDDRTIWKLSPIWR